MDGLLTSQRSAGVEVKINPGTAYYFDGQRGSKCIRETLPKSIT